MRKEEPLPPFQTLLLLRLRQAGTGHDLRATGATRQKHLLRVRASEPPSGSRTPALLP